MAKIKPFRAWRYNRKLQDQIEDLTSPLFDVISQKQREMLYGNPLNSIHLSVPGGSEPVQNTRETLSKWKREGIIEQDPIPGIYVYYQYFTLAGSERQHIRKGFIANLYLQDWEDKVVLRHEGTMPVSVEDRAMVLENTELNVSPTHGLYTDPNKEIEKYLDEAMKYPLYEAEDYQGVKDVLSVIHDRKIIKRIIDILDEKPVILADGHHRYEGSLAYRNKKRSLDPSHTGNEGYNYHMMYFTNTESDDLRILPTHRVFSGLQIPEKDLLLQLEEDFIVKPVPNAEDVNEIILGKQWAFGLLMGENAFKIRLKPEKIHELAWDLPDVVKYLDPTVLHYFLIEKILGIPRADQPRTDKIKFERNFTECLKEVIQGEAEFAIITKEISIETVKDVCYSGYTLPQKTTYFYPKAICGFLFSSIRDDEFTSRLDSGF